MTIDIGEVRKIAHLARLELTDAECAALEGDLNAILAYVAKLEELDTTGVPTLEHAAEAGDTWRDDANRPSLPQAEALAPAREAADGCFSVPKIIEGATE